MSTPSAPAPQPSVVRDLGTGFGLVLRVLSALSLGIPAWINAGIAERVDELTSLWQVVATTFPVVAGVAVVSALWFRRGGVSGVTGVLVLLAALVAGSLLGFASGVGLGEAWDLGRGPLGVVVYLALGYVMLYGWVGVLSAIVVGVFAGWAWRRVVDA